MKLVVALSSMLLAALATGCALGSARTTPAHHAWTPGAWTPVRGDWWRDAAWHDGQAEECVYEATRTIYGVERRYVATAYTNKERVDPKTTCKTEDPAGIEVFKHHWSEVVPTERYDYRFSTMGYLVAETGAPFKLTVSTQEDCGASFKECWKTGERFRWSDSVYFPGAGRREGEVAHERRFQFADTLALALRYLRAEDLAQEFVVPVVPAQKDTHQVGWELSKRRVRGIGRSTQELPIGRIEAEGLEVLDETGAVLERFWFAADETAPLLRAMVRYEGPGGVTYRLKSHERTAYWKR